MIIDWSKAPDGATHYATNDGAKDKWLKVKPSGSAYHHDGLSWIRYPDNSTFRESHIQGAIARPEISEWDGEGLPPVGVRIEAKHKDAQPGWARPGFYETEIVAMGRQLVIFEAGGDGHEKVGTLSDYIFRPIRTPEQIAAEERDREVDEMIAEIGDVGDNPSWPDIAAALHAAGYRKTTE